MESFVILQPNVSGLSAMYELVEGNVHKFSSSGVPTDAYGKLLVYLLNKRNVALC